MNPVQLANLVARSTRPALVWYGPGERIELSGKVLANHVSKIANFLADEAELEASPVLLDLPTHWKTITWALGALVAGGQVRFGEDAGPDDVVVTTRPENFPTTDVVVALNLASLAFSFDGDLGDALDGSASVMGHPDALMWRDQWETSNWADFAQCSVTGDEARIAVVGIEAEDALPLAYECMAKGRTLVLVQDPAADAARIAKTEGATLL